MFIDSQSMVLLAKIIETNKSVSLQDIVLDTYVCVLKVGEEEFTANSPSQAILEAYNSLFEDNLNAWESFSIRVCSKNEYIARVDDLDEIVTHEINKIAEKMVANPSNDFIRKLTKLLFVEDNAIFRFEKKDKTLTLRKKKPNEHFLVPVAVNTVIKDLLDDAEKFFTLRDRLDVEVKKREYNYNKSTEEICRLNQHLKQLLISPQHREVLK